MSRHLSTSNQAELWPMEIGHIQRCFAKFSGHQAVNRCWRLFCISAVYGAETMTVITSKLNEQILMQHAGLAPPGEEYRHGS